MRPTAIEFQWAGGTHKFDLPIGELRKLQDKTKEGPFATLQRLLSGTWRLEDVRETIRHGLEGGGMRWEDAVKLVDRYVDNRPLLEAVPTAVAILGALMHGAPDEARTEDPQKPAETEQSTSPASTETPQSSGSVPETATVWDSGNGGPLSVPGIGPMAVTTRSRPRASKSMRNG